MTSTGVLPYLPFQIWTNKLVEITKQIWHFNSQKCFQSNIHENYTMQFMRRYYALNTRHCFQWDTLYRWSYGSLVTKHTYKSVRLGWLLVSVFSSLMTYVTTCTKYPIEGNALWDVHSVFSYVLFHLKSLQPPTEDIHFIPWELPADWSARIFCRLLNQSDRM